MDCIRIKLENGSYIPVSNQVEDWEAVISFADKTEHVCHVDNHKPYTECYKVIVGKEEYLYLVEMFQW